MSAAHTGVTPAHDQQFTFHETVHYPAHEPRADDPHYAAFEAWRRAHVASATCAWADRAGTTADCAGGLEAHHELEFALTNAVDFDRLKHAHPEIASPADVDAWVESGANAVFLCAKHHRADGAGIHKVDAAMWASSPFVVSGTISA